MSSYVWRESHSGIWRVDAQWADRLLPLRNPSNGKLQAFPLVAALRDARSVKGGRNRRTLGITIDNRQLYVKQYDTSWRSRRLLRREWLSNVWAHEKGLPVPRPVAACWKTGQPTLITEDAGSLTLSQIIHQHYYPPVDDEPPYPGDRPPELIRLYRRRNRSLPADVLAPRQIARLLADLLVSLDRLGLRHRDLHPGNLVLREDPSGKSPPHLVLLDLLELEQMPGRASLEDHLVQLNHYFEPLATRSERYRLLRLLEERGLPVRRQAADIERQTWQYHRRQWQSRDARAGRASKYFRKIRAPGFKGMAAADVAAKVVQLGSGGQMRELWQSLEITQEVKSSRRGRSGFGHLGGQSVFIKRDTERGWRHSGGPWPAIIDAMLRGTRQQRAWHKANSLLVRGIGTARPLLWLDRHHGLAGRESLLVTEALGDDWQTLDLALSQAEGRQHLALVDAVARTIRRLHDSGLSHRDLKAQNLLVRLERTDAARPGQADGRRCGHWQVALVDMEGLMRHAASAPRDRRVQNLMRLAFSWSGVGISGQASGLTRGDRLRFLKVYLGGYMRQTITMKSRQVRGGATVPAAAASNTARLRRWWQRIEAALRQKATRARV